MGDSSRHSNADERQATCTRSWEERDALVEVRPTRERTSPGKVTCLGGADAVWAAFGGKMQSLKRVRTLKIWDV